MSEMEMSDIRTPKQIRAEIRRLFFPYIPLSLVCPFCGSRYVRHWPEGCGAEGDICDTKCLRCRNTWNRDYHTRNQKSYRCRRLRSVVKNLRKIRINNWDLTKTINFLRSVRRIIRKWPKWKRDALEDTLYRY